MDTLALTLYATLFFLALIGMTMGAYLLGYQRGAKMMPASVDPTPEQFEVHEARCGEIETGYLAPTTGPVEIVTTTSIEIIPVAATEVQESAELIATLTAKLARAERLRKRYLRLLREERSLSFQLITGGPVFLTRYWCSKLPEYVDSYASSGALRIANT